MPLISETERISRAANFAMPRETKCMNCGKTIFGGGDIYSRRFCSDACRLGYLL